MHKAAITPAGGEEAIRYEIALVGLLARRAVEHMAAEREAPKDYASGMPLRFDYNAVLEALLLHIRNVIEFLMMAKDPGTRSAVQFDPDWPVEAVKSQFGPLYGDLCGHLSHIAVRRPETAPDWRFVEISEAVIAAFETLVDRASRGEVRVLREGAAIAREALTGARAIEAALGRPVRHSE